MDDLLLFLILLCIFFSILIFLNKICLILMLLELNLSDDRIYIFRKFWLLNSFDDLLANYKKYYKIISEI